MPEGMPYDEARQRLIDIDKSACESTLNRLTGNVSDEMLVAVYEENVKRFDQNMLLLEDVYKVGEPQPDVPPEPPEGYKWYYFDDFDTLNTSFWSIYGPGNSSSWGIGQGPYGGRVGYYTPDTVDVDSSALIVQAWPDRQGRTSLNGKRAWECGFLASKTPIPPTCYLVVKWRIDRARGFWPAPLWVTQAPNGSSWAEVDTMEWFSDYPEEVRQAIHLRNAEGAIKYNMAPKLNQPQAIQVQDFTTWNTSESYIQIDKQAKNARFIQLTNSEVVSDFRASDFKSEDYTSWIPSTTGWNVRVCTQMGGQGGAVPDDANGPYLMTIDYIGIAVPK